MASPTELRKLIADILESADLNSITAKKVRQELETKLETDLSAKKKDIDNMVLEILQEKQNGNGDAKGIKRKTEDSDEEEEEESEEELPKKKRGKKKDSDEEDSDDAPKKPKKKAAPKAKKAGGGGGGGGTGFTKLCKLSPELAAIVGGDTMARHEVVKKMWAIIKEKNLADPKNRQYAICNAELLPVFGVKRFRCFGMMKFLKNHIH